MSGFDTLDNRKNKFINRPIGLIGELNNRPLDVKALLKNPVYCWETHMGNQQPH